MTTTPKNKKALGALASFAFAVASLGALAPARALTNCTVSAADLAVDSEEAQLLDLINAYRQANGLNPLVMDTSLTRAAAWFSRDMATDDYFPADHVDNSNPPRDVGTRLTQCDVTFNPSGFSYGENIAAGNATAEATFQQWVNSPTHNAIMLTPGFTHAGIGRAFDASSTFDWYWTLDVASGITSTTSTSTSSTTSTSTTSSTTTLPPTTTSSTTTLPPTTTSITSTSTTLPPTTTSTTSTSTTLPPTTTSTTTGAGTCGGLTPTIVGTGGDDQIFGTAGPDVISGGGGNDQIRGLGGDDVICGEAGNDQIFGGEGNDRLFGGAGVDQLFGENGNDTLSGGAGTDRLSGGEGDDALNGDADADQCMGDAGTDSATACEAASTVP